MSNDPLYPVLDFLGVKTIYIGFSRAASVEFIRTQKEPGAYMHGFVHWKNEAKAYQQKARRAEA